MLTFFTIAYSQAQDLARRLSTLDLLPLVILFVLNCLSTPTAISAQQTNPTGTILLTEIFYNTPGIDGEQEWVELANLGSEAIDLSDYKLGDEEQSRGGEAMRRFPQQSLLAPGQVVVVAQSARGFRALYGRNPDFELNDSDPNVPDMRRYIRWSVGDFALANDGDELLLLDPQDIIIDSINYGDKTTYFSPAISSVYLGQSLERVPANCDTDSAADWQPSRTPTPGTIDRESQCAPVALPTPLVEDLLTIGQIQGPGDISPLVNQQVEFRGLVTGFLEDRNSAGITFYTLFVQDLPGYEDADPQTSDAIALFLGRRRPAYDPGDLLQVSGLVTEFYGLTEIDDQDLQITVESTGHPLPEAVPLVLPQDPNARSGRLESLESMRVAAPAAARVVGPTHTGCGFALRAGDAGNDPMPRQTAAQLVDYPLLILYQSDVDCRDLPDLKKGDTVSGAEGPLTYHFDQYKIVLQNARPLQISPAPWMPLPPPFQPTPTQVTIATFNLHDHFDGKKDMPSSAEPVVSAAVQAAKQRKLAAAIGQTLGCPALIALQEIENEDLLHELAVETAAFCPFTYQISHRESSDSRGLDLALLSDHRRIQIDAVHLQQTCTALDTGIKDPGHQCAPDQSPLFGRPPLQVDLHLDDLPFTLIVNHFKSKRDGEEETAARRLQQAAHIAQLVASQQAVDPQARIIVLGDFNDYEQSPTMRRITESGGLTNVLARLPLPDRYTYIFDGVPQLLDSILVSPAVSPLIAGVMIIHANANYPARLASDTSPARLPYHASDHDLPLLLLNLPAGELPASPTIQPVATPQPTPLPTAPPELLPQPSVPILPLLPVALFIAAALALLLLYIRKM